MTISEYFERKLSEAEYEKWHDIRKFEREILKLFIEDEESFENGLKVKA